MTDRKKSGQIKFRVLSYNIHQGLTVHRQKMSLSLLKEAIKLLRADLVLLQEVAGTTTEKKAKRGGISGFQLESLADSIWPHFAYQKNAAFSGGFHGNAILSRYPVIESHSIDITVAPLDKRGVLHGVIHIPTADVVIHALTVHLGLLQFERRRQVKQVNDYIHRNIPNHSVCVLGGDFNDWQQKVSKQMNKNNLREVYREMHRKHARTFPSRFPILPLDRIYFRYLKLHGTRCLRGKPWHQLSDHLPLLADFII